MAIAKVRLQVRAAAVSIGQDIEGGRAIDTIHQAVIAVTANLTHLLILLMEVSGEREREGGEVGWEGRRDYGLFLYLQELPYLCAEIVCEPELLAAVVKKLQLTQAFVCASPDNFTPQ